MVLCYNGFECGNVRRTNDAIWFPVEDEEGLYYSPRKHLYKYSQAHVQDNRLEYNKYYEKRRSVRPVKPDVPAQVQFPGEDAPPTYVNTPRYWQQAPVSVYNEHLRHQTGEDYYSRNRRDISSVNRNNSRKSNQLFDKAPPVGGWRPAGLWSSHKTDGFGTGRRPAGPSSNHRRPFGDGFGHGKQTFTRPPQIVFATSTLATTRRTPPTTTSTTFGPPGEDPSDACERRCQTTPEFNPVCASDSTNYTNPGKLKCAQMCGKRK